MRPFVPRGVRRRARRTRNCPGTWPGAGTPSMHAGGHLPPAGPSDRSLDPEFGVTSFGPMLPPPRARPLRHDPRHAPKRVFPKRDDDDSGRRIQTEARWPPKVFHFLADRWKVSGSGSAVKGDLVGKWKSETGEAGPGAGVGRLRVHRERGRARESSAVGPRQHCCCRATRFRELRCVRLRLLETTRSNHSTLSEGRSRNVFHGATERRQRNVSARARLYTRVWPAPALARVSLVVLPACAGAPRAGKLDG
jgi:hypothetical protein